MFLSLLFYILLNFFDRHFNLIFLKDLSYPEHFSKVIYPYSDKMPLFKKHRKVAFLCFLF